MNVDNFVPLHQLCIHYRVEMTFFSNLNDYGLIEILTIENAPCISQDRIGEIEKIIRMYQDLNVNLEGIDIVFNLLERITELQKELTLTKNRLRLFDDNFC